MITQFRQLVSSYEAEKKLAHVTRSVTAKYEAAAVLKKTGGKLPLVFEHIDGYTAPVVAGIGGSREAMAASMEIAPEALTEHLERAVCNPLPVTPVTWAPVQENVILAPFTLTDYFPVFTYYAKDAAPFLVAGVLVNRDMTGQKLYTSIRRMQYLGGNRCNILFSSEIMKKQLRYHEENRIPLDIAVMFGVVPAVMLSSQLSSHLYPVNKLDVAGALLGESLPVVRCKTVNVEVLANAEVVLEGQIKPWLKETEGPFGEMAGYYGGIAPQPVVEFSALTFRHQPVFQTLFPSGCEERLPMALTREMVLLHTIRQTVPQVKAVHLTMGGVGRYHAVIQIVKSGPGDGVQAALAAFAADKDLKHAVVVDQDVDLFDMAQVEWALATRVQADRDIFVIPGAMGSPLEPSHNVRHLTAKMGIDATCPLEDVNFQPTTIPGEEKVDLAAYLDSNFIDRN